MPMGAAPNPRGGLGPEVVEQVDRPDAADAGWVSLFNGKDLAGWRPPEGQGEWKVVGNALTGTAAAGDYGILATGREYANFHLRAEVRLTGPGNSGILFRSENGYQAEIDQRTTGSIARSKPFAWLDPKEHTLVEPGAWFQLEVIADGPRFTSKVNGQVVADVTDRGPTRGYVALELNGRQNGALVVEFRKVEIRELPARPSDADRLQGVWQAVAIERTGRPVPEAEVRSLRFEFAGNKLTSSHLGKGAAQNAVFTLGPDKDPKQITVKLAPDSTFSIEGIYRFDGDRLVICMPMYDVPKSRPTKFAPRSGRSGPGPHDIRSRGCGGRFVRPGATVQRQGLDRVGSHGRPPGERRARVVDGVLVCDYLSNLRTEQQYHDYELTFEYRHTKPPRKNDDLLLLFHLAGEPAPIAPCTSVRLLNDGALAMQPNWFGSKGTTKRATGELKPSGEWNRLTAVAKGATLAISLNGEKLGRDHRVRPAHRIHLV